MGSKPDFDELAAHTLFNVNGLVALITGGGTGIGLMMAKALARNGATRVYVASRRLDILEAAAASIGPNVIPIHLRDAAAFVEKDIGYLNLLVCNAGTSGPHGGHVKPETTVEQWADDNFAVDFDEHVNTFAINTASTWFTTMAFLKLLDLGNKRGNVQQTSQVIVISSGAAFNKKAPSGWVYGHSKAATTAVARHLATTLPQWNIRSNCIAPGWFPSEMTAPFLKRFEEETNRPGYVPKEVVPMQRVGDEQDMAGTILHLVSRVGAYCNGVVVFVDGGRLTNFPSVV